MYYLETAVSVAQPFLHGGKYSTIFSSKALLKNIMPWVVSSELLSFTFDPFNFSHRLDPSVFHCCFSGLSEVKKS
jgi:hypothetical protein